jgi:hypothetical protein
MTSRHRLHGFWRQRFPGQIPDQPAVPERLDGASIELEGRALIPIDTGYTDTADSTSLHVPSIRITVGRRERGKAPGRERPSGRGGNGSTERTKLKAFRRRALDERR